MFHKANYVYYNYQVRITTVHDENPEPRPKLVRPTQRDTRFGVAFRLWRFGLWEFLNRPIVGMLFLWMRLMATETVLLYDVRDKRFDV